MTGVAGRADSRRDHRITRRGPLGTWPSGRRDGDNLSRVNHRNSASPCALAGGLLIEHRHPGHGHRLRRSPGVRGRWHAWRGSEYPRRAGRGDDRRIGRRVAHAKRRDVRQRHEIGDRRQGYRREGIVGRAGGYGEHRRRNAHVAHYLSALGNQNRHKNSVADSSAVFNSNLRSERHYRLPREVIRCSANRGWNMKGSGHDSYWSRAGGQGTVGSRPGIRSSSCAVSLASAPVRLRRCRPDTRSTEDLADFAISGRLIHG